MVDDISWLARDESRRPRIAVIGDSYCAGSSEVPAGQTIDRVACRELSAECCPIAQGGTGYVSDGTGNDPSNSPFGSAQRLAAAAACQPDLVAIVGGVNDQAAGAAAIQKAAAKCLADLRALLPETPIVVVGPQPTGGGRTMEAAHHANVQAVAAAARKAGPGVAFEDWTGVAGIVGQAKPWQAGATYRARDVVARAGAIYRARRWIDGQERTPPPASSAWLQVSDVFTGTGHRTAPTGDGNRDLYISADGTHPTGAGSEALGLALAARIAHGAASLRDWTLYSQVRSSLAGIAYAAAHPTGDGHGPRPRAMTVAYNGFAYKDGTNAGTSVLRIGEAYAAGFNAVHMDCWMTGDERYILSTSWQLKAADGTTKSIYNNALAALQAVGQPAGAAPTVDEVAAAVPADTPLIIEYGPSSASPSPSDQLRSDTAKFFAAMASMFGDRMIALTWPAAAWCRAALRAAHPGLVQLVCLTQSEIATADLSAADIVSGNAGEVTADGWQTLAATGKQLWMHNCSTEAVASNGWGRIGAAADRLTGIIAYTQQAAKVVTDVAPAWN